MDTILEGGFSSPVLNSQTAFRAVMDALANPGTVQKLVAPLSTHRRLSPELVSILLTLSDHDAPIWLDDGLRGETRVRAVAAPRRGEL